MSPRSDSVTNIDRKNGFTPLNRNESLELLNPSAESPLRKTTFIAGTFNLVATIVGGGVLSLPLAFAKTGILLGTAMLAFSAVITDFSLYLMCCCARRTGCTSYMDIVRSAFGPVAEICTTASMWIFLSGVLVAFDVLLMGIFAPLARDLFTSLNVNVGGDRFDAFTLFVILLIVSPLTLKKNLYALRHICYVGFTSVCVVAISIGIRAVQRNMSDHLDAELIRNDVTIKYVTTDWIDALFAFPIYVLAFLCSFNIVEVQGALKNPSRERVKNVIHTSILSSFVLFQAFGLVGYFYAYDSCKGNIFLNFDPSDSLIIVGRLGMGLTLMFATPVVTLPCREAFLNLISLTQKWWSKSEESAANSNLPEEDTLMDTITTSLKNSNTDSYSSITSAITEIDVEGKIECAIATEDIIHDCDPVVHVFITFMITTYAFLGAVSVPGVAVVWSVLGSSLGMIIGFIIPCACYLKIRERKGITRRTNFGALALLVFSVLIAILCTVQTISGMISNSY